MVKSGGECFEAKKLLLQSRDDRGCRAFTFSFNHRRITGLWFIKIGGKHASVWDYYVYANTWVCYVNFWRKKRRKALRSNLAVSKYIVNNPNYLNITQGGNSS